MSFLRIIEGDSTTDLEPNTSWVLMLGGGGTRYTFTPFGVAGIQLTKNHLYNPTLPEENDLIANFRILDTRTGRTSLEVTQLNLD